MLNILQENDETCNESFSDTSFLPIRVFVSLDASLSAFAAWPQLPLAQVVFPCQVPVDAAQSEAHLLRRGAP